MARAEGETGGILLAQIEAEEAGAKWGVYQDYD
jgi:hypothetical protein